VEFRQKKQKNCADAARDEAGDLWDHPAVAADSKRMVSLVGGKRTKDQTHQLGGDAKSRLRAGHLPAMLTDGYEGYEAAMLESCGRRYPAPNSGLKGRPSSPVIRWPQGLAYGQVMQSGKENASDGMHLKVIRGKAQRQHVLSLRGYEKMNTRVVERHHGTSRRHNQRKGRKTLAFSKSSRYHRWMSWLSVVQDNFCRAHGSLRLKDAGRVHHRTPAMAAGLTDCLWATRDWLLTPVLGGQV
jgi:IS1 family transposase